MKKKSPKPVAKTSNKQTNVSGRKFIPPAYEIDFVDSQNDSNDAAIQGVFESAPEEIVSANPNKTGLPDNLKTGIENLSGFSMDEVQVHYNSSRPAQFNALAYTQGTEIHIAPGQERHLPHEAWHTVQQKQGRVKPTMQLKGKVNANDDAGLEKEADVMGEQALQTVNDSSASIVQSKNIESTSDVLQRFVAYNPSSINKRIRISDRNAHDFGATGKIIRFSNNVDYTFVVQFDDDINTYAPGEGYRVAPAEMDFEEALPLEAMDAIMGFLDVRDVDNLNNSGLNLSSASIGYPSSMGSKNMDKQDPKSQVVRNAKREATGYSLLLSTGLPIKLWEKLTAEQKKNFIKKGGKTPDFVIGNRMADAFYSHVDERTKNNERAKKVIESVSSNAKKKFGKYEGDTVAIAMIPDILTREQYKQVVAAVKDIPQGGQTLVLIFRGFIDVYGAKL